MINELSLRPLQPTFAHSPNFTLLFHTSFDFPLPRFNHHHILFKVYHIICCSWLFRVRHPFFFVQRRMRFLILGRWLGLKTKYHNKSRNRRPWYPRMTLNFNIYNLGEQNAQYVKGLNPGVIDRPGASGPECTFLHRTFLFETKS